MTEAPLEAVIRRNSSDSLAPWSTSIVPPLTEQHLSRRVAEFVVKINGGSLVELSARTGILALFILRLNGRQPHGF
jgi:hypothetical protein